jgi:hypothetical protein
MAPKPKGYNRAGYLVPGAAILSVGAALVMLVVRRRGVVAAADPGSSALPPAASAEEMERLRQALAEVED